MSQGLVGKLKILINSASLRKSGPGSIILMLIGAFSLALNLTNDEALIFNVVIVGVFIGACIFAKADHQIRLAELLSVLYAVIMIAVYIGVILTVGNKFNQS